MSTKIKLGQRPDNFKPFPVKFDLPDGTKAIINATYIYRTKTEFAAMMNKILEGAGQKTQDTEQLNFVDLIEKNMSGSCDQILDSLAAWDQEFPLDKEHLMQLADEIPAATAALLESYSAACNHGRLGN